MKIKFYLLGLLMLMAGYSRAQVQNALDFDNVDDYVNVPAASALINGLTHMSLTCWVYPTNSVITFPDYDGFCGFRNNTDADFYMIQHANTSVEARFRNSGGTNYDVVISTLQINAWNHFAFVYGDGAVTLYQNGVSVGSTPASGSISNQAVDLLMGSLPYSGVNFYLKGKLDEVSLWSKTLTSQEVHCIYLSGINANDPSLLLYYNFNEGQAGLNNAGLNTLTPSAGTLSGTLNNFMLFTNNSNWVQGVNIGTTSTATICSGQSYMFGGQALTNAGTYTHSFPTSSGCDSTVILTLTVNSFNLNVTQVGVTLSATQAGGTYQWLNCDNGNAPITGATGQSYTATANGHYAAKITFDGCTDTTACKAITTVGFEENNFESMLQVYPVPFTDKIHVNLGNTYKQITVSISDLNGRIIFHNELESAQKIECNLPETAAGMYFLAIQAGDKHFYTKIVK
ncbi:MAG: LamG-like jellyroll fold domain-containing protein [Bacteroidota bacterium]